MYRSLLSDIGIFYFYFYNIVIKIYKIYIISEMLFDLFICPSKKMFLYILYLTLLKNHEKYILILCFHFEQF